MNSPKQTRSPMVRWVIYLYQYVIYLFKLLLWKISRGKFLNSYKRLPPIFCYSLPILIFLIITIPLALTSNNFKLPARPLTLKTTPSKSNFYYTAKNQTLTANIGEKDSNQPAIEVTSPKGGKVGFAYASDTQNLTKPEKEGNSLTFSNIDIDTDVKYTTLPNGIKEEIILKSPPPQNEFKFNLSLTDATPKKLTGNIYLPIFYNSQGEYIFHFDKPFAVDSAGEKTYDLQLQIIKDSETGQYSGKITTNPVWLHDPKRVYPVIIDPTIVYTTASDFQVGSFNRVSDTGTADTPSIGLTYRELPADEHTTGLYHFEEQSGTGAYILDSSSYGSNCSSVNSTSVAGLIGQGRSLDGSDSSYVICSGINEAVKSTNITQEVWTKINGLDANGALIVSTSYQFGLFADVTGIAKANIYNGTTYTSMLGTTNIADGDWHHLASILDNDNDMFYLYVDGNLEASMVYTSDIVYGSTTIIGSNQGTLTTDLNGIVDEYRVSNIVRSPEEIKADATIYPYGIYLSDLIDANLIGVSGYNPILWTQNLPTNSSLNIQLRSGVWGNLTNIFDGYDNYSQISSSTSATIYGGKITTCIEPVGLYLDLDGDGYGATNTGNPGNTCKTPNYTYVANNTDCDDTNNNISRTVAGYLDSDGDTYGYGSYTTCAPQTGTYVANNTDCDDTNNAIKSVVATGGTITNVGNDYTHTFTASGTFALTCPATLSTSVLVVGGGGGAGYENTDSSRGGGGGGAGGLIYIPTYSLSSGSYTVTIGTGGSGGTSTTDKGDNGQNTIFGSLTALGGGGGGSRDAGYRDGNNGGSGGGGGRYDANAGAGGTGLQSSQTGDSGTYGYGYDGAPNNGGGGGAGGSAIAGAGGIGKSVFGATYAAGGKWGGAGANGTANKGNGGDTKSNTGGGIGGAGGSGIVIVKYTLP